MRNLPVEGPRGLAVEGGVYQSSVAGLSPTAAASALCNFCAGAQEFSERATIQSCSRPATHRRKGAHRSPRVVRDVTALCGSPIGTDRASSNTRKRRTLWDWAGGPGFWSPSSQSAMGVIRHAPIRDG
jgi:hypothetical protein